MPGDLADACISQNKDWLYGLCLRLERNRHRADDLFQETWLKALERFDSYDRDRPLRPWLARICVNTYRDGFRRKARWLELIRRQDSVMCLQDAPSAAPSPEAQTVDHAFKQALASCLDALDDKYRLPLILQYYNGIGYENISKILAIKQGTVKSRLNEAKSRLRKHMEALGYVERY